MSWAVTVGPARAVTAIRIEETRIDQHVSSCTTRSDAELHCAWLWKILLDFNLRSLQFLCCNTSQGLPFCCQICYVGVVPRLISSMLSLWSGQFLLECCLAKVNVLCLIGCVSMLRQGARERANAIGHAGSNSPRIARVKTQRWSTAGCDGPVELESFCIVGQFVRLLLA